MSSLLSLIDKKLSHSSPEEKAEVCREVHRGAWAFEHQGVYYCFMAGEQPCCAGAECKEITKKWYSSDVSQGHDISGIYHVCGVRS